MLGHPYLDQLPDSLDRAGENPGYVTAEDVFDMMGNLHEWTADPADRQELLAISETNA